MHIPDAVLREPVWISTACLAGGAVILSARAVERSLDLRRIPLMGVLGAFVFAAQMVNFAVPLAGATSGHFVGASLLAILLGPFAGLLVMAAILAIQALIFADGGITALGANISNMALLASFVGYLIYRAIHRPGDVWRRRAAAFVAGWAAIVAASIACAVEIALSGRASIRAVVPAMALVHAAIGIAEGLINAAVLEFLAALDPGIVEAEGEIRRNRWVTAGVVLLAALAVGGGFSALASSDPDGLERVAADLGIGEGDSILTGLLPDYAVPGVRSPFLSNLIAGVLGALAVTGVLAVALLAIGRRRKA